MITTVTLNAAIDKTYIIPGFNLNSLYRAEQMNATAGGKGINVARVIRTLGEDVIATGFVAGFNGMAISEMLRQEGIPSDFITVEGESRLCLNVIDPEGGTQTELLEAGPSIPAEAIESMKERIAKLASRSSHVVFSGSLPKGCQLGLYAELIAIARGAGAIPVLDTSGEALVEGIAARPYLIKPNEHEVVKLTDGNAEEEDDIKSALLRLAKQGIANVVVSLGERGALSTMDKQLFRVSIPRIDAVNAVGSGDSMVAGLVVADKRALPAEERLKLGAACGTANALMPSAGMVRLEDVEALKQQIQVGTLL
ncbi:1-phosphofructokinase [Paenibacillus sp. MER TA 81-3]|uniref:1-phosphofructokinase n=1 Tax=Paenibacillus sp. MER TA 81-3 TaxID=2939573 RepID=UPI00203A4DD9|nr:1-phosphofructokinase [Paenibacillus sp. MER TA 81-3]MCM3341821.1 1-phosphofructokinase [Paenibacillus sp. MER TA 81-3]